MLATNVSYKMSQIRLFEMQGLTF